MEKPRSCILRRVPGVSKGKNEQQTYRKSSINPSPLSNKPPLSNKLPPIFQGKKVDKPPPPLFSVLLPLYYDRLY